MKCGYAKADITPSLGVFLQGYPTVRKADSIHDHLYLRTVLFNDNGKTAVFMVLDLCGIPKLYASELREKVAAALSIDVKYVFTSCTHTHTGPSCVWGGDMPADEAYFESLKHIAAFTALSAQNDLRECSFYAASGELRGISFVRRYLMKDGSVKTNPGRANPDIVAPANEPDYDIKLVKIVRENADDIALINFQVHPDTIGGCAVSADYPGVVCDTVEGALPGTKAIYFNGAIGDLNHINVNAPEWEPYKGFSVAEHTGRTIAGKILEMYTKARPIASDGISAAGVVLKRKFRSFPEEKIPYFRQVIEWYAKGEYEKITSEKGMQLTIAAMEARKAVELYENPIKEFELPLNAMSVGELVFSAIPGEPFCEVAKKIKSESGRKIHFILSNANGKEGYFPTREAFEAGGYEARTSQFEPGLAEDIAAASLEAVKML